MGDPSSIFTGLFKITGALGPGAFHLGGEITATPGTANEVDPQGAVEAGAGLDIPAVPIWMSH